MVTVGAGIVSRLAGGIAVYWAVGVGQGHLLSTVTLALCPRPPFPIGITMQAEEQNQKASGQGKWVSGVQTPSRTFYTEKLNV